MAVWRSEMNFINRSRGSVRLLRVTAGRAPGFDSAARL
jgi:hypothetical protein